jgi:hypothetical protein
VTGTGGVFCSKVTMEQSQLPVHVTSPADLCPEQSRRFSTLDIDSGRLHRLIWITRSESIRPGQSLQLNLSCSTCSSRSVLIKPSESTRSDHRKGSRKDSHQIMAASTGCHVNQNIAHMYWTIQYHRKGTCHVSRRD